MSSGLEVTTSILVSIVTFSSLKKRSREFLISGELLLSKDIEKDLRVGRGARQGEYSIASTSQLYQNLDETYSYTKTETIYPETFWT